MNAKATTIPDGEAAWPAYSVKRRSLAGLVPHARNSRLHTPAQVQAIAASMREFGWTLPILVDEAGGLIAGHARIEAAKLLGWDHGPVAVATGWTDAQKRAYVIADNQLASLASWHQENLQFELGEIKSAGFDLNLIGFSDIDLAGIFAPAAVEVSGGGAGSLAARFGIPPFTVLNAREGWWQERKAAWLSLGIESELGRGENLLKYSNTLLEPDPKKRAMRLQAERETEQHPEGRADQAGEGESTVPPERSDDPRGTAGVVAGNGWGNGGPARRDAQFYIKKRAWEKANGRKISTKEFRECHWDGASTEGAGKLI